VATALDWYEGRAKMLEKPPEEKEAEVSGTPVVAPTDVMLYIEAGVRELLEQRGEDVAHKGQPDGKVGTKVVQSPLWDPETPPSPEEKRMEVPRAPS